MERSPKYRGRIATKYVAEGREEGRAEGVAASVLTVLTGRGIELSAAQRTQLAECADLAQLEEWLQRALTATSANELFG